MCLKKIEFEDCTLYNVHCSVQHTAIVLAFSSNVCMQQLPYLFFIFQGFRFIFQGFRFMIGNDSFGGNSPDGGNVVPFRRRSPAGRRARANLTKKNVIKGKIFMRVFYHQFFSQASSIFELAAASFWRTGVLTKDWFPRLGSYLLTPSEGFLFFKKICLQVYQ